ncbi:MAG: helix-turn-helix domain-containing protein [Rhodothalassiaceae bacterium]
MSDKALAHEREDADGDEAPLRTARAVDLYVGQRLRTRRNALGLTQQELAGTLKISYQQIQKYETGGNRISAGKLFVLARALDMPVNYFFDEFEGTVDIALPNPPDELMRMARQANAISDDAVRRSLMGLIKSLSGN